MKLYYFSLSQTEKVHDQVIKDYIIIQLLQKSISQEML